MDNDMKTHLEYHISQLMGERNVIIQRMERLRGQLAALDERIQAAGAFLRAEYGTANAGQTDLVTSIGELGEGGSLADAAEGVLASATGAMTISDLLSELALHGVHIRTRNARSALYTALLRAPRRFRKVGPATFALVPPQERDTGGERRFAGMGLTAASVAVLADADKAMHVRDIWDRLTAGGYSAKTQRPLAMLSGTLQKSPHFERVGKDTFQLRNEVEEGEGQQ